MVDINGSVGKQMQISQDVQNALKTDKAKKLIGDILADGKVDSKDNENLKKLRTHLEGSAAVSSNDDDLTLIDALDSTGGFLGMGATNKDIVQRNLTALNEKYKTMDPSELSFKDVKIETEGLLSTTAHSLVIQEELDFCPVDTSQLQADLDNIGWRAPILPPAQLDTKPLVLPIARPVVLPPAAPLVVPPPATAVAEVIPDKPLVSLPPEAEAPVIAVSENTPAEATPRQAAEAPVRNFTSTRQLSNQAQSTMNAVDLDTLQSSLQRNQVAILENMRGALSPSPAVEGVINQDYNDIISNIEAYKQNPSTENLDNLSSALLNPALLQAADPDLSRSLTETRAAIETATNLDSIANNIESDIGAKKYSTPLSASTLLTDLDTQRRSLYTQKGSDGKSEVGPLPLVSQDLRTISSQINALKNSPLEADQQAYQQINRGFKDIGADLEAAAAAFDATNQRQAQPDAQILLKLNQVAQQMESLKLNASPLGEGASEAVQALRESINKSVDYGKPLQNSISSVESTLRSQARLVAELQTAGDAIYDLLQPADKSAQLTDMTLVSTLTEQLRIIQQTQSAIENGQEPQLSEREQKQLEPVLQSLYDASDHSIDTSFFNNFGLGLGFPFFPIFPNKSFFKPTSVDEVFNQNLSQVESGTLQLRSQFSANLDGETTPPGGFQLGASIGSNSEASPLRLTNFVIGEGLDANNQGLSAASKLPNIPSLLGVSVPLNSSNNIQAPPSLGSSLLKNAASASHFNRVSRLSGLDDTQKKNLTEALDSKYLTAPTKAYLNEAIAAQELVDQGKGDTLTENGVPARERAKDLALLSQTWAKDMGAFEKSVELDAVTEQLKAADAGPREPVHAKVQETLSDNAGILAKKSYETRVSGVSQAITSAASAQQALESQLESLGGDNQAEYLSQLSTSLQAAFPNRRPVPNIQSAADLKRFFNAELQGGNTREIRNSIASLLSSAKSDFTQAQRAQLQTLFSSSLDAIDAANQAKQVALNSMNGELSSLMRLRDAATEPQRAHYDLAIHELGGLIDRIGKGDLRETDVNLYQSISLVRNLSVQAASLPAGKQAQALGIISDAWTQIQTAKNSSDPNATVDIAAITSSFTRVLGNAATAQAVDKTLQTTEGVSEAFSAQTNLGEQINATGEKLAQVTTILTTQGPALLNQFFTAEAANSEAGEQTQQTSQSGVTQSIPGASQTGVTPPGGPLETILTDLQNGSFASNFTSGKYIPVRVPSLGSVAREQQELDARLNADGVTDLERAELLEARSNLNSRQENMAATDTAFDQVITNINRARTAGPEGISNYFRESAIAQTEINRSCERVNQALAAYAQVANQSASTIKSNNLQIGSIQKQALGIGDSLAERANQLIQDANQLAESLILAPRSDGSANSSLSNLVRDFLETIQNQQFETQKITMAMLAQQMLNQTITAFYKEQQDDSQAYHEDALQLIADNFKQRMQSALETTLVSGAESGQSIAGLAGRVSQSEVSAGLSEAVQASGQEFMAAARQAGLPIAPVVEQLLLGAMERIVQLGAAVATPEQEDDRQAIRDIQAA